MVDDIKAIIAEALPDAEIYVIDPYQDGQHFQAIVISPSFTGLSLIKQHQAVMNPLRHAFEGAVHALGLKTFTPEKWETEKHAYFKEN